MASKTQRKALFDLFSMFLSRNMYSEASAFVTALLMSGNEKGDEAEVALELAEIQMAKSLEARRSELFKPIWHVVVRGAVASKNRDAKSRCRALVYTGKAPEYFEACIRETMEKTTRLWGGERVIETISERDFRDGICRLIAEAPANAFQTRLRHFAHAYIRSSSPERMSLLFKGLCAP